MTAAAALAEVNETELRKLSRAAQWLDIGQPAFGTGQRPHRTRPGQGAEFLDFRHFRPGEDVRRMDWRISARRGKPFVRTYHDELSADWMLCLDRSASMGLPDGGKWTLAVQMAAAFAYLLLNLGNRVALVTFSAHVDEWVPLGRGRLQYLRIAAALRSSEAETAGGGSSLAGTTSVLGPGMHLAIFSDFLRPDGMRSDLEFLRSPGRKIHAIQMLAASEAEVQDQGARSVRDIETGESVTLGPEARRNAHERLRQTQDALAAFSARNGIRFSSCAATDRWQDVILRHIAAAHG